MNKSLITISSGILLLILCYFFVDCSKINNTGNKKPISGMIFEKQNKATKTLYNNLKKLSNDGKIMFGMANPTTISYKDLLKSSNTNISDCKDITGSNPAFYESDFMWYSDSAFKRTDIEAMKAAYNRGAVCGYCWHFRGRKSNEFYNKKDGKFTNDKELLKEITASDNRSKNLALDWYLNKIDNEIIPVFKELGFPIVFRPFHEMNGNWFWWGSDNCTPAEYIKLFRLTVDYLRSKKVNNLLYAWSVNVDPAFEYYPGDDYVDILGLDSYEPGIAPWNMDNKLVKSLQKLTDYADSTNKIAALTETGCRKENGQFNYPDKYPDFWTKYVFEPILNDPKAKRIVWVMSWYSSDWQQDDKGQFYIPYQGLNRPNGDKAISDFKELYNSEAIVFENNIGNMYQ